MESVAESGVHRVRHRRVPERRVSAVKTNDVYQVYLHMLTVNATANRKDELLKLIGILINKFKQKGEAWRHSGIALKVIGMRERQSAQPNRQLTKCEISGTNSEYDRQTEQTGQLKRGQGTRANAV